MIFNINLVFLTTTSMFFFYAIYSSLLEREMRMATIFFLGFGGNLGLWMTFLCAGDQRGIRYLNAVVIGLLVIFALISSLRFFPVEPDRSSNNITRFDERDHMFSRNNLKFHKDLFEKYYHLHPERRDLDMKIHRKPELGDPNQVYHDPLGSPLFDAAFNFLGKIRPFSGGESVSEKVAVNSAEITRIVKKIAFQYGAVDVGFTRLKSHHLYSHAGRHAGNWGKAVKNDHRYGVVIVVAMNEKMIRRAPALPVILESSRQYVEAAKIAFIIAEYLRLLGYEATAHTDGNYEILCVPMAIDAGLGELGRLGILIHPRYGPCVRLSVVTTNMEFEGGERRKFGVRSFCSICKKCAQNCPTKSIPEGQESFGRGTHHWFIEQERCFAFWKKAGTDCGFCIRVCPYTKPDSFFHQLVRLYVSRNPINQRIALFFDGLLYGKRVFMVKKNPDRLL